MTVITKTNSDANIEMIAPCSMWIHNLVNRATLHLPNKLSKCDTIHGVYVILIIIVICIII